MWGGQCVDDRDNSGQAHDQKPHADEGDDSDEGPFDTLTSGVEKFSKKDMDQADRVLHTSSAPTQLLGHMRCHGGAVSGRGGLFIS